MVAGIVLDLAMEGGSPQHSFVKPIVGWNAHKLEIAFLAGAILTPLVAIAIWKSGDAFQRSGGMMVFFAVSAEFITLNKANRKHLINASRAYRGEEPWTFSNSDRYVGLAALLAALVGTLLWVFGDLIVGG